MVGEAEGITGVSLIGAGVVLITKGVDLIGTDFTSGVASIGVGAGFMVAGFLAVKYGILKASIAAVAKTFKVKKVEK